METKVIRILSTGFNKRTGEPMNAFRQRLGFLGSLSNHSTRTGWNGLPSVLADAKELEINSAIIGDVIIKAVSHGWVYVSWTFKKDRQGIATGTKEVKRTIRVKVLEIDGKDISAYEVKNPLAWFVGSIADRSEIVLELDTTDHR